MKQVKRKNTSHTFILKNINISDIDKKYGIKSVNLNPLSSMLSNTNANEQFITKIEELHRNKDVSVPENITMIDSIQKQSIQSTFCFWCRHPFNTNPIGCPISYKNAKMIKQCSSEITKETYIIAQSITSLTNKKYDLKNNETFMSDYYETEGVFCSFNCCMSYINDNIHNPLYKFSKSLLLKMYVDLCHPKQVTEIHPAPSWKLLKDYGGQLDIETFRNSMNEYRYDIEPVRVTTLPKVKPIGYIYDKHYIF